LKGKFEELETKGKINNIRDLHRGNNDVKKGYQPRTGIVRMRKVTWLRTPMALWRGGGTIPLRY